MVAKSQVYNFVVVLKNKNRKAVQITGILFTTLSLFLFLFRAFRQAGSRINLIAFFVLLILLSWSISQIRKNEKVSFSWILGIAGFGLLALEPFNGLGLFYFLMGALEKQALKPQEIGFSKDHIRFNGLIQKKQEWNEFTNILLKDGILTMDFRNNKLLQKETDDEDDPDYDGSEDEFNEFCGDMLSAEKKS